MAAGFTLHLRKPDLQALIDAVSQAVLTATLGSSLMA